MAKKLSKKVESPVSVVEADAVVMPAEDAVRLETVETVPEAVEVVTMTASTPHQRVSRVQADIRKYGRA